LGSSESQDVAEMERRAMVNESFKPHEDFKKLYYVYLALGSLILYFSWAVPLSVSILSSERIIAIYAIASLFLLYVAIVAFMAFWIPKFCGSIVYLLTESDIVVERGVWWKHKSIVPYNRVTNVDVIQGPLSRRFGLGKISIQTAGFSSGGGGSQKVAEAAILGIKNFDEVKDFVMNRVRRLRPVAVEAESEPPALQGTGLQILEELRKIRENLEKRS